MSNGIKFVLIILAILGAYFGWQNYSNNGSIFKYEKTPQSYDENFVNYGISFPSYLDKGLVVSLSKATNETSYRKLWDDYQMQGDRPSNSFRDKQIFFLTTNSDTGCPDYIYDVKVKDGDLHFYTTECNVIKDGYLSYTFAFALDAEAVKDIDQAILHKNDDMKSVRVQQIY